MKNKQILERLRKNSRISLSKISNELGMPISTVHDRVKKLEKTIIKKYTTIIDYQKAGYNYNTNITIKTKKNEELKEFLKKQKCVNNLSETNNGYIIETINKNIKEHLEFKEKLNNFNIEIQENIILENIKKEEFNT